MAENFLNEYIHNPCKHQSPEPYYTNLSQSAEAPNLRQESQPSRTMGPNKGNELPEAPNIGNRMAQHT